MGGDSRTGTSGKIEVGALSSAERGVIANAISVRRLIIVDTECLAGDFQCVVDCLGPQGEVEFAIVDPLLRSSSIPEALSRRTYIPWLTDAQCFPRLRSSGTPKLKCSHEPGC